jgi:hypothetical protein
MNSLPYAVLAKFAGQSVTETQETANLQILSLQESLFSSGAFWRRLAGQGETQPSFAGQKTLADPELMLRFQRLSVYLRK